MPVTMANLVLRNILRPHNSKGKQELKLKIPVGNKTRTHLSSCTKQKGNTG